MNKLLFICGLVLLGSNSTTEEKSPTEIFDTVALENVGKVECAFENQVVLLNIKAEIPYTSPESSTYTKMGVPFELDLNEIEYIEEESIVDLGFDAADYLPEGFDPQQVYLDLNSIEYVEEERTVQLNFNVSDYLPEDFDSYASPKNVDGIAFVEEETIDLGFDTSQYLPEDFDPYVRTNM